MPGPGRGPPAPGPAVRGGNMPGPGRGPAAAGRGAAGRGGMPGVAPPGRGIEPGVGAPGRDGRAGDGAGPGRAAGGRGGMATAGVSLGELNGLLPGRGPGAGGRSAAGAAGASATGASGAAGRAGPGTGAPGREAEGGAGSSTGAAPGGWAAGAGGDFCAAGDGAADDGAAAGGAAGKASRNLRTTGASTVEEADLTNSPFSFNQVRTLLLSIPSSLASSWTRAFPGTGLLRTARVVPAPGGYCMGVLMGTGSSSAHRGGSALSGGGVCPAVRSATCSRTGVRSSGPSRRRARGNARRLSARSRHRGSRCTQAPRPGSRPSGSGASAPPASTTRSRSAFAAWTRQPTHVRCGPGRRAVADPTVCRAGTRRVTSGRALRRPSGTRSWRRPRCRCECRSASR